MNNPINLSKIIAQRGLNPKELAAHLYPQNLHPLPALNRVLKGEAQLDENQISKLAALLGVSVSKLFEKHNWQQTYGGTVHTFTNENCKAILDTSTWVTRIFYKDSLVHTTVLSSGSVTLEQYFLTLNTEINKFKNAKIEQN